MKQILVVAAHPDDEVIGCGAAIAKHVQSGDEVHVAILAEGITSRDKVRNREQNIQEMLDLQKSANMANAILGVSTVTFGTFPDNRMDSIDLLDVTKFVEELIEKINPDMVYTHYSRDVNIDHQIINHAVITACRPLPGTQNKTILFFEVASSTEWQINNTHSAFSPNWFVDVSDTIDLKIRALHTYKSEMRNWPHARSVQALEYLAKWRGATIGVEAAEAFILGRHIA